jgi:hypothetical protein
MEKKGLKVGQRNRPPDPVFLSNVIYDNLNESNKKLCSKDAGRDIYQANVVNVGMNNWLSNQK